MVYKYFNNGEIMTKKIKSTISLLLSLCFMLCLCLSVFAETETDSFENSGTSTESTTLATSVETSDSDVEQDNFDTTNESEEQTESNTATQPAQTETESQEESTGGGMSGIVNVKPVKPVPSTTETENSWEDPEDDNGSNGNGGNNDNGRPDSQDNKTTTFEEEETSEEESLPEGSYYLYLERNNGERRLKLLMEGTGYVSVPNNPVREGFTFVGWYTDPEFKNPWDFYKDKASGTMTFYAKWDKNPETVSYKITVEKLKHGKIEVSPSEACQGEIVFVYVTPDEGKRLVPGSLKINGKSTDLFTFTMPDGEVKISALFENAPKIADDGEENNAAPFIIIAVILFLIVAVSVVMVVKRRNDFNPDYDPDNPDIDDEDEDVWIDESIVVEDAFENGVKKINEDFVPDFGTPEDDDD